MSWSEAIWHSLAIKKCLFIFWLVVQKRLITRDRLISFGLDLNPECLLCGTSNETHVHLFEECPFISLVMRFSPIPLQGNRQGIIRGPSGSLQYQIQTLFISVAIYLTWRERNARVFSAQPTKAEDIGMLSKRWVREKLFTCKIFHKAAAQDFSLISMLY